MTHPLLRRRRRRRQLASETKPRPPRCRRCRRRLTDAASLACGLGPHCLRLVRRHRKRQPRTAGFPAVRAYRRRAQIPGQTEIDLSERTRP